MNAKQFTKPSRILALVLVAMVAFSSMVPSALAADRIENLTTTNPKTLFTYTIGQGASGASISISTTKSHSHTVSGSIGISVSIVQASVGYAYNTSQSVSYSYSRTAPLSSRCYRINAYDNFTRHGFKWVKDYLWPIPDSTGNAVTQNHKGVTYTTYDYAKPLSGC